MSHSHHSHSHASHHQPGKRGLARWQKNLIHGSLLVGIAVSLYIEGTSMKDSLFFLLSIATEVS